MSLDSKTLSWVAVGGAAALLGYKIYTTPKNTPAGTYGSSDTGAAPATGNEERKDVPYTFEDAQFATRAIHAGQPPDAVSGAITVPISLASTFVQASPGVHKGYEYSRSGNPTRDALESCVAALENGKYGLAFASGSAALATITALLKAGEHIICMEDVYGGTNRFLSKVGRPSNGLKVSFVDLTKPGAFKAAITPKTKMVWIETPTNPMLSIVDIQAIANMAHRRNITVVVDNTFATSYLQQPLEVGADIVAHSATKYLNGHSDVVMGIVAVKSKEIRDRLAFLQNAIGAVPSPFDCYMVLRGIKTLQLRMEKHCANAAEVARLLEASPKVEKVIYPGLPSHPQYKLAQRQMRLPGGMVSFYLKGGMAESRRFLENLHLFGLAESLGAVECLAEHPAIMTHASVPVEQRKKLGIADNFCRLSVGIEHLDDVLADLKKALAAV